MDYIFHKEKLEGLISDFYISTGIAMTLYDASGRIVAKSPIYTDCCACIRAKEARVESCDRSDKEHMELAAKSRQTCAYTCHAGLMEVITPIVYEDVVIAYLQIGQFRDTEQVYSSRDRIRKTAEACGLPPEELLALYEKNPELSREKLRALLNIIHILIRSFWEDGLILRNRSMRSVKIEQYISEHLGEPLSVEALCRQFSMSKFALYSLFREEFHCTVNGYILEKRMALARKLLKGSTGNITQVAESCGFADYNYFIRVFRDRMGITPLQYRKQSEAFISPAVSESPLPGQGSAPDDRGQYSEDN